ncbi:MAG: hypothetical protein WDA47_09285 [Bacilli bacterium]
MKGVYFRHKRFFSHPIQNSLCVVDESELTTFFCSQLASFEIGTHNEFTQWHIGEEFMEYYTKLKVVRI